MKTLIAIVTILLSAGPLVGESGKELDRKILRLLLSESEVVVHARRDTGGFVGTDAAIRARYRLVGPV